MEKPKNQIAKAKARAGSKGKAVKQNWYLRLAWEEITDELVAASKAQRYEDIVMDSDGMATLSFRKEPSGQKGLATSIREVGVPSTLIATADVDGAGEASAREHKEVLLYTAKLKRGGAAYRREIAEAAAARKKGQLPAKGPDPGVKDGKLSLDT